MLSCVICILRLLIVYEDNYIMFVLILISLNLIYHVAIKDKEKLKNDKYFQQCQLIDCGEKIIQTPDPQG